MLITLIKMDSLWEITTTPFQMHLLLWANCKNFVMHELRNIEHGDKNNMDDFAILILSCDKYKDLWPVTLKQFHDHFKQCPYKIYFGSNAHRCDDPSVIPLLSGEDKDWSSSYLAILKQIPEKKLFVLLEDLIVVSTIDPSRFSACVEFLVQQNANHIKYWPITDPNRSLHESEFQVIDRGAPYRATVCGFWDREYMQHLLIPGENPWNFEVLGSYRTSYLDGFYQLATPLFKFINLIGKGFWIPVSLEKARQLGIEIDTNPRGTLKGGRSLKSAMQIIYFNLVLYIPWRYRISIMAKLRKLLISY